MSFYQIFLPFFAIVMGWGLLVFWIARRALGQQNRPRKAAKTPVESSTVPHRPREGSSPDRGADLSNYLPGDEAYNHMSFGQRKGGAN